MNLTWMLFLVPGFLGGLVAAHVAARVLAVRDDVEMPVPGWVAPVAGVVTAGLFSAAWVLIGPVWVLPAYLAFVVVTVTVTITDIHCRLIPNRINFWGLGIAGALLLLGAVADGATDALQRGVIGGLGFFLVLYGLWFITGGRLMGGGDVKLTPLLGLFTAYIGWDAFTVAIFAGIFIGGLAGIVLVIGRMAKLRDHFAYGPALVLGAYVGVAWGAEILDWYLAS